MTIGRFPAWANIIVSVTALAIVGAAVFSVVALLTLRQFSEDISKPEKVELAAQKVANFPKPLPDGYRYMHGYSIDWLGWRSLAIENGPVKHLIIIIATRTFDDEDPKKLVYKLYDRGINTPYVFAKFQEVKFKGECMFDGVVMPYIVGEYKDSTGKNKLGMVGCAQIKRGNEKSLITVFGLQMSDTPYNQDVINDLLKAIR